ncbi:MAG: alpha/beta hydrolase [Hyphomonadaceae bacterium]|nr:alpha/beta hydrolase [Hyphomonadaceae bacterium]
MSTISVSNVSLQPPLPGKDMSTPHPQTQAGAGMFKHGPAAIHYEITGAPLADAQRVIVWAHGWGQNREAFRALASSFSQYTNVLLDFPGFGVAPPPPESWGTAEYADLSEQFLKSLGKPASSIVWVGHSFGCRIGLQLASRHPGVVSGMCLIAAAGLKRKRSFAEAVKFQTRIRMFKLAKVFASKEKIEEMRRKAGSADYQRAGAMRPVFVRVVNEDLTEVARNVACPTILVFGENDNETPPEMGERLSKLIANSKLFILPRNDHYTVLADGRHVVAKRIAEFMGSL